MRRSHPLVVAGKLIEKFAALAHRNTDANIETCAILCGAPVRSLRLEKLLAQISGRTTLW